MAPAPARSWWTEVEHLREPVERRRRAASAGVTGSSPTTAPMSASARRSVRIRGHVIDAVTAPRLVEDDGAPASGKRLASTDPAALPARRPTRGFVRPARIVARPDHIALWAVAMGLMLVLVAALSGHS